MTETDSRTITRVRLRNYKSVAACDVELAPLTLLVGPNGSGKSNFLDALRFTAQALRFSLDHALRERGGIRDVRRRSRGHPNHFGIRLDLRFDDGDGLYAFEVGARPNGGYFVRRESCRVRSGDPARTGRYRIESGELQESSLGQAPPVGPGDRLYLLTASGYPVFRPVYDLLSGMGFYNLNPSRIAELQSPGPGDLLDGDGGNIASLIIGLRTRSPASIERIVRYLAVVAPGTVGVEPKSLGPKLTLEFLQRVRGDTNAWRFLAANMSDGTLRAFGVLVALFQGAGGSSAAARLVGIEEPESALHPAAAGVLTDVLREASARVQVVATTHSADLLDQDEIPVDSLRVVLSEDGETKIVRLDETGRGILRDGLSTAGELLRLGHLAPDPERASPDGEPGGIPRGVPTWGRRAAGPPPSTKCDPPSPRRSTMEAAR